MQIEIAWNEEALEYRRERGLEDDMASRAALTLRLAGLLADYNRLTGEGRHEEAARIVQWMVVPSQFFLKDPGTGHRYECVHTPEGVIRVVSGYAPEEPHVEPREMPEAP